eukprot:COSAG02_NODE_404_length_23022_cov_305.366008_10_plen_83_part_00
MHGYMLQATFDLLIHRPDHTVATNDESGGSRMTTAVVTARSWDTANQCKLRMIEHLTTLPHSINTSYSQPQLPQQGRAAAEA